DLNGADDEDGVSFTTPLQVGTDALVAVVASTGGVLNAWLDFNANGTWADSGEQIFTNQTLAAGTNVLTIHVPADASAINTFARFRFSTATNLSFTGPAPDGEVEDHAVTIVPLADLGVTIADSADPVPLQSNFVYTVTATNAGPSLATTVMVTNILTTNLTFVSAIASQGSCVHAAGVVRCTLNDLTAHASATITLTVSSTSGGSATNTATITAAQIEPSTSNDTFIETTTIEAAPAISVPPSNLVVTQGNNAAFSVVATGTSPLSYQWLFQGSPIAQETNTTLTISNAQPANAGNYSVRVTNRVGTVTSIVATLTVLVPPGITQQPQGGTNAAGSSATLSVTASG